MNACGSRCPCCITIIAHIAQAHGLRCDIIFMFAHCFRLITFIVCLSCALGRFSRTTRACVWLSASLFCSASQDIAFIDIQLMFLLAIFCGIVDIKSSESPFHNSHLPHSESKLSMRAIKEQPGPLIQACSNRGLN